MVGFRVRNLSLSDLLMLKFPALDAGEISTFRHMSLVGWLVRSSSRHKVTDTPCPLWLRLVTRALQLIQDNTAAGPLFRHNIVHSNFREISII